MSGSALAGRRVLFVSHSSEWMGPTNSLYHLLRHPRERHNATVVLPGCGEFSERLRREGFEYRSLPWLDKRALPALYRLIRRGRFELVYANNTHGSSRIAFLAAKAAGVPFICHVRGMGWGKSWPRLGHLRFADAVVAVSHACADSIRRFVLPERLHVIHNGVSVPNASRDRQVSSTCLRSELDLLNDALVLMSVAHLCERKGQEYLLEALEAVRLRSPTARLCLVGSLERDPEYVGRIRARAEDLGIADGLHLLGWRSDVDAMLCEADVFVHSAVADPHPRSVLEAMAAALPVVAFSVDGVAETVVDGETGFLVEPGDSAALARAILTLLEDRTRLTDMGMAGRMRVEREFSDVATAERIWKVINEVLSKN